MPTAGSIGSPFFFLPAPSSPLARPSASASTAASVPARSAAIGRRTGAAGRTPSGSSTTCGSPPWACDHRAERLDRLARVERRRGSCPPLPHRDVREPRHRLACEHHRRVAQATVQLAAQQPDGLDHVERVPDRLAERLRHVGHRRSGRTPPVLREGGARLRELGRVLGGLHERAAPGLHVQQHQVGADRELLRHHARRDQRDRRDGRRGVPERVQGTVGRHEVGGLRGHRRTDLLHLAFERVRIQVRSQARDRLELVEGPAGVPEPAAGELGHREPERRRDRREHERHAVGHATGRVLVDLRPRDALERECHARVDHRAREGERLGGVQAVDERGHQQGRGLVVGDLAAGVPQDERPEFVGIQRAAVALGGDHVAGVVHAPIPDAKLEPSRSHGTPRSSATVAPRSAYVSRSPMSNGPPSSPAPSSGVRSRE